MQGLGGQDEEEMVAMELEDLRPLPKKGRMLLMRCCTASSGDAALEQVQAQLLGVSMEAAVEEDEPEHVDGHAMVSDEEVQEEAPAKEGLQRRCRRRHLLCQSLKVEEEVQEDEAQNRGMQFCKKVMECAHMRDNNGFVECLWTEYDGGPACSGGHISILSVLEDCITGTASRSLGGAN